MIKKLLLKTALIVVVLFLLFICYSAYGIWSFADKNQLVKTDAAIVLGAATLRDKPSPVLRERINHSIWLYENHYVDKLIFTGGKGDDDTFAESEVARMYAIKNNVNSEDIFIETKSKITEENLQYAKGIAVKNDMNSFTIVSDPLHMKRAMLMAEDLDMEVYSSPTPSSVYKSFTTKLPFFFRELFFYVGYIITLPFR
ncbi:YdcF family protein [Bacillus seohaeanensis]|uniref:YdcF family protein n=1 Tax=Bacillus seohaeanensis TaxID=284580 RepID=A0ABW5RWI3_9BACI